MEGVSVAENSISYLWRCLEKYQGACGYLLLFVVAVCVITVLGDKRERLIFLPMTLMMILTVYNPVFPVILNKFADIDSEYYRFFWITPVIVLIPYMITRILLMAADEGGRDKKKGLMPVIVLVLMIASASEFMYSGGFKPADNIYKMPDELIEISELIHKDSKKAYPKVYLEFEYNMQMRQYDPKLLLTIDREDYITAMQGDFSDEMIGDDMFPQYRILAALTRYQAVDIDRLKDALEATHTDYIVLTKGSTQIRRLERIGIYEVGETENHVILKNELEEPYEFEFLDYSDVYRQGL